jgi:peptidoglycan-associated lipoprotein
MKKITLLFALIAISVLTISGCASMDKALNKPAVSGSDVIATAPCVEPAAPVVKAAPAPAPAPKPVLKDVTIYFNFDKHALKDMKPSEVTKMKDLVAFLKANPGVEVRLDGHTDWHGSDAYNMTLGQKRSDTVKKFLVDNGIDAKKISTLSKGEKELVSKKEAWPNRRVVVIQLK